MTEEVNFKKADLVQAVLESEQSETQAGQSVTLAQQAVTDAEALVLLAEAAAASVVSAPQMPMTMFAQGDNEFACLASIIVRPTGTVVSGGTITWQILNNANDHESSFIRSATANPATQMVNLRYPTVKSVLSFLVGPDESFTEQGVFFGATVGVQFLQLRAARIKNSGFRLTGNGTTYTITTPNTLSLISVVSGLTTFSLGGFVTDFDTNAVQISYVGTNNYRIQKVFSGLGAAVLGFKLVDISTNTVITTAPTSDDVVIISNAGSQIQPLALGTWGNPNAPQNTNIFMSSAGYNFWCIGLFELWLKAAPISSTKMLVKWQQKAGVTSYTLRRSTAFTVDSNGDYVLTSPVTIYTGIALEFTDLLLTANTMYYYQLLDQGGVEISQFNNRTKI